MPRSLPRLTDRIVLGDGLLVSPVCLGAVSSPRVVLEAFEAGMNFFFITADMHWPIYEPLRRGVKQLIRSGVKREELVVCSAAYVTQPDFCSMPHEEVLEALGLSSLDVLVMGGVYAGDFAARLKVYDAHRADRFVGCRAVGASFHDRPTAKKALSAELVDVGFIRMNPAHPGAVKDVLPALKKQRSTRVFNFKSLDAWTGSGDATEHYRFALSQPGIDGVLASFSSGDEVRALGASLKLGALDSKRQAQLISIS